MLEDSININKCNWNPVVLKKIAKTSKYYPFLAQLAQKWGLHGPHPKQKTLFKKNHNKTKPDHTLLETFCLVKISFFWQRY